MGEDNLQLWGGDWTEQKLEALDRYLQAYATALSKTNFRRVYIDAFAGTGYRQQAAAKDNTPSIFNLAGLSAPEPQRFLDGSAKKALRVTPAFDQFIFIENNKEKVRELQKLKTEFRSQAAAIDIREGDANDAIRALCRVWDKRGTRGVLFLDPYGMQVEWEAVRAIAGTESIDTWILFPFAANRLMTQSPIDIPSGWRTRLTSLFGTKEWESRFYKERAVGGFFGEDAKVVEKVLTFEKLGAFYRERLEEIFPAVAPNPRVLRSSTNQPLFQLFFAAGNKKGGKIAIKIAGHILNKI